MLSLLHTKVAIKLLIAAALPLTAAVYSSEHQPVSSVQADLAVPVVSREMAYRIAGEFIRDGKPVDAPLVRRLHDGLVVMKVQVTVTEYASCVKDGGCRASNGGTKVAADLPVVGVSWEDATAYARWFSHKSGQKWRLPTDEEWAFFAAERFSDDALSTIGKSDFSERWLAKYNNESARDLAVDRAVRPSGAFGENTVGISDLAGNVWEWTNTCFRRETIDANNISTSTAVENCGVRVVEGRHRAYVTNFVRDARAGGCAVGVPPANLGFRLVRDRDPAALRFWVAGRY